MRREVAEVLIERRIDETRPSIITFLALVLLVFGWLAFALSAFGSLRAFNGGLEGVVANLSFQASGVFQIVLAFGLRSARDWAKAITLVMLVPLTVIEGAALMVGSVMPFLGAGEMDGDWLGIMIFCFGLLVIHGALLFGLVTGPAKRWFREANRMRGLPIKDQEQMVHHELLVRTPATFAVFLALCGMAIGAEPTFQRESIFPAQPEKHNHASCVVELPGGDLLTAWYNGTGEREADDVKILGARLNKSTGKWTPPFLLADTPGYPDCNPALFAAPDKTLWMFWPTILDHRWEGALLKFAMTDAPPAGDGPATWKREGVLHVTPTGFDKAMADALKTLNGAQLTLAHSYFEKLEERSKDELYQRLGWMPRVHPTVLPSGCWLLPLYSDTFSASIVAISDDQGASWSASRPIIGFGNIQPSIVRKNDGTLVAYMRENGPRKRIRVSTSGDEGMTWSPVADSTLLNPGAGIEALRLANGHWAMIYNDTVKGRHSLAVSLSDDEGTTWSVTRHVATGAVGDEQFHYPSIIQSADGRIHTTFTNSGKSKGSTIDHAVFNEEWVRQTDAGAK